MARIENYLLGMDCGTTNIKAVILEKMEQQLQRQADRAAFYRRGLICRNRMQMNGGQIR